MNRVEGGGRLIRHHHRSRCVCVCVTVKCGREERSLCLIHAAFVVRTPGAICRCSGCSIYFFFVEARSGRIPRPLPGNYPTTPRANNNVHAMFASSSNQEVSTINHASLSLLPKSGGQQWHVKSWLQRESKSNISSKDITTSNDNKESTFAHHQSASSFIDQSHMVRTKGPPGGAPRGTLSPMYPHTLVSSMHA